MNLFFINIGLQEMILIFFIPLIFFLVPFIFYILFLRGIFSIISPENRKMPPENVWLLLIPFFGLVWQFIVVRNMADSLHDELNAKGIPLKEERPAYNIGLAMCILNCCLFIPGLNAFAGVAALVCWIIYWVKLADYKNQLQRTSLV